MTLPAPKPSERETETLWVTDVEMIRRMGVGINAGRKALQQMRKHPKFPPRSIGGKTYWKSAVDFFDLWNGRRVDVPGLPADQAHVTISGGSRRRPALEAAELWLAEHSAKAEVSNQANEQAPKWGRARPRLAAAKERLARRMAGTTGGGNG